MKWYKKIGMAGLVTLTLGLSGCSEDKHYFKDMSYNNENYRCQYHIPSLKNQLFDNKEVRICVWNKVLRPGSFREAGCKYNNSLFGFRFNIRYKHISYDPAMEGSNERKIKKLLNKCEELK